MRQNTYFNKYVAEKIIKVGIAPEELLGAFQKFLSQHDGVPADRACSSVPFISLLGSCCDGVRGPLHMGTTDLCARMDQVFVA